MVSGHRPRGTSIGVVCRPVRRRRERSTPECPSLAAGVFGNRAGAGERPVSTPKRAAAQPERAMLCPARALADERWCSPLAAVMETTPRATPRCWCFAEWGVAASSACDGGCCVSAAPTNESAGHDTKRGSHSSVSRRALR